MLNPLGSRWRSDKLRAMKRLVFLATLLIPVAAALAADEGFRPLFNGKDLSGWKLRNPKGHNSWSIQDGILMNTVNKGEHGTDLVTDEKFWNFTVRYEYKVPPGANSGFYLRGRHELQILDDAKRPTPTKNGNGSIYNFKAPDVFASKPSGEWQAVEATMIGNKITVTLNGKKIHDNVECNQATGSGSTRMSRNPVPCSFRATTAPFTFATSPSSS